jgi:hypothetical protein
MTEPSHQELSRQLFEAARQQGPTASALERAEDRVMAGSRDLPSVSRWSWRPPLIAAGVIAVAAGAWLWVRSSGDSLQIRAETWFGREAAGPEPKKAPASVPKKRESEQNSASPAGSKQNPGAPKASSSPKPAPSLGQELDALQLARDALGAGDSAKALEALDHYDRVLHGKQMRAEAMVLRMEALAASGQRDAASRLAERFLGTEANHPLADRARTFLVGAASSDAGQP